MEFVKLVYVYIKRFFQTKRRRIAAKWHWIYSVRLFCKVDTFAFEIQIYIYIYKFACGSLHAYICKKKEKIILLIG